MNTLSSNFWRVGNNTREAQLPEQFNPAVPADASMRAHNVFGNEFLEKRTNEQSRQNQRQQGASNSDEEKERIALIRNPHKEVSKMSLITQYIDDVIAAQGARDDLADPVMIGFEDDANASLNGGARNGIVGLWETEGDLFGDERGLGKALPANSNSAILNQLVVSHCGDSNDRTVAKSFISWESRPTFPQKGFTLTYFRDLMSVKFWERINWTVRCALLCITPVSILTLHPNTTTRFVLPGFVMDSALWVTAPTLGEGLREIFFAIKGFGISIGAMAVLIQVLPKDPEGYIFVLGMFIAVVITSALAPDVKKTSAYGIAVLMFASLGSTGVDYRYLLDFGIDSLIGFAMGIPAFLLPFPVQSHTRALKYCGILANSISSAVQGVCDSFWTSSMQREFNLVRLRALHSSIGKALDEVDKMLAALIFELHSGVAVARLQARRNLLYKLIEVVRAGTVLIEDVAKQPWNVETRTCEMMGERLGGPVRLLATSVDQLLLRIADCNTQLVKRDFVEFERTFADFEEEVRCARNDMMLFNDGYEPEIADIYLGCFLFILQEICSLVGGFQDPTEGPSILWQVWIRAPFDWLRDIVLTFIYIVKALFQQELPRKVKEALKLGGAMAISAIYQFYSGSRDPITGTPIVPWIYQRTGADSFHYAINRVLGTVIGSVLAFIGAELADGSFWWLIASIAILSCVGSFIQTSIINTILGNAMLWSIISISSQYSTRQAAAKRIQTNVFAVIVYLLVATLIWPIKASARIFFECECALRAFRDATTELCGGLHNEGDGDGYIRVLDRSGALLKEFKGRIETQSAYLTASGTEPTLAGNPFPTEQWSKMIRSMLNLHAMLGTMQYAYFTFNSSVSAAERGGSRDAESQESVHTYLCNVMGDCTRLVGTLLSSSVDLYIILLRNGNAVSTNHLVRLRVRLVQALTEMQDAFCQVYKDIIFEVVDEEGNAVDNERGNRKGFFTLEEFRQGQLDADREGEYSSSNSSSDESSTDVSDNQLRDSRGSLNTMQLNGLSDPLTRRVKKAVDQAEVPESLLARFKEGANAIMGWEGKPAAVVADSASDLGHEHAGGLIARRENTLLRERLSLGKDPQNGAAQELKAGEKTAADSVPDAKEKPSAPILTTEDIHSLEAFLFGIGALVMEAGALEKAVLEMKNAQEIFMKI